MRVTLLALLLALCPFCLADDKPAPAPEPELRVTGLPYPLTVLNQATEIKSMPTGSLIIKAPGRTNLFNNPNGKDNTQNAPMALFEVRDDFILTAKVSATLKAVYDVGALVLYVDKDHWAKLCFENSVDKIPLVVSVVTRGLSDDCNSAPVGADHVYLAIAKKGEEYSFHSSSDGKSWHLVRHFHFSAKEGLRAGFAAHGSFGDGVEVEFSEVDFQAKAPAKMRQLR